MAIKEPPPPGLLESFDNPLWERLELVKPMPLWIVRSQHRGYEWTAIELQHGSVDIFSEGPDTTTVFVAKLPERSEGWYLPSDYITSHRQVSLDREYLYLAALGRSPSAREWPRWLDKLVDVADQLIRTRPTAIGRGRGEAARVPKDEITWNPHNRQWIASWLFVIVPLF